MPDHVKIAVEALQARARDLIEERDAARRRLLRDATLNVQLERDIAGCVAGARALEHDIDVSSPVTIPQAKQGFVGQFQAHCGAMANLYGQLKTEFGIADDSADGSDGDDSRPEMPRIGEIILDRLQVAGEHGASAADIRRYILKTYTSDIHEKTVGMTLNRMQTAGQVRREGRTWFLPPFAPQPAGNAPSQGPK